MPKYLTSVHKGPTHTKVLPDKPPTQVPSAAVNVRCQHVVNLYINLQPQLMKAFAPTDQILCDVHSMSASVSATSYSSLDS